MSVANIQANGPLSNVYIIILILCSICVGTRLLSSYTFRSVKYGQAFRAQRPPTLPYWVPFLRHALSMAWDSQRFVARCFAKHGDGTPFFIDAAGNKLLVILDPFHIKKVMSASKELDPNPFIYDMILGQVLGTPQEVINIYKSQHADLDHKVINHLRSHVTGASLVSMSQKVFERLSLNISNLFDSDDSSECLDVPDLYNFLQTQTTIAVTETLLGSRIMVDYPEMCQDQWTFMDKIVEIVSGLPRFVIPAAYAARDRLLAYLKQWSLNSEKLRENNEPDKVWDKTAGSSLLQERQELFKKTPGFNEDGRASQILGLLLAQVGNSITPLITFWFLFESLRDPKLLRQVSYELQACRDEGNYNFAQLAVRPILQSLHAEITRLYASNLAVRVVTAPTFDLDDKYTIEKGTTLFIYNKITGQFTPGWTEARSYTTSRPLEELWPERFLVPGSDKRERFSDAGLAGNWTSFGGGLHKCPGRHFARNIGIVTLAVLLGDYECVFVDAKLAREAKPNIRDTAFGKMMPPQKIAAKIRRRCRS